jgi:hypothetical protein
MKAKTLLLRLTLFIPFIASQAVVGLTAEAKKEKAPKFVFTTFENKRLAFPISEVDLFCSNSSPHGDLSADRRLLS